MRLLLAIVFCLLQLIGSHETFEAHEDWAYLSRIMQPYNRRCKARMIQCILQRSEQFDLPSRVVGRLIRRESDFRHWVQNNYNARGLMQVTPHWDHILYTLGDKELNLKLLKTGDHDRYWKRIGYNIHGGCKVLSIYRKRYSLPLALLAYNRGSNSKYFKLALVHPIFWVEDDYVQEVLGDAE